MRQIIKSNGLIVPLALWQAEKGFTANQLGRYFSTNESPFNRPEWLLHELLFEIVDELRHRVGKPIRINSAYRTVAFQRHLQKINEGAVANSPHTWGLALDVDTVSFDESDIFANMIRQIAKEKQIMVRIGLNQYKALRETFIHFDVAPMLFGEGRAWSQFPNIPQAYKSEITW